MRLYVKKTKNKQGLKETLWIDFTHNGVRYRKPLKLDNTPANKKLARNHMIPAILQKISAGEFFKNIIPTFNEFSQISFDMHSESRKQTTQDDYKGAYRLHIEPAFGTKKIDSLKPSHIQIWQNKLLKKLSPRRVRNIRAVLSGIYQDALKDKLIDKSPLSLVPVPKVSKADITPFSISEILTILDNAEEQFKNFYALGFFSGLRSGEMIGLKWSDIDFTKNEISISRTIKMGVIGTPKTEESVRTIDLLDTLLPYLQEQYKLTGAKNSYVFLNAKNEHFYDIKRIRNTHWKKVLKLSGLEYRPIYHTRHTFATMMLENNEDILWVSSMLGHSDPAITLSHYAKYVNRKVKKRGQFLEKELALNGTIMAPDILKSA